MTIAETSLGYSGLYEAELLVELMLRYWKHPHAEDRQFRNDLLEGAASALRVAISGEQLIAGLPARQMNLVAAIWYVETNQLEETSEDTRANLESRRRWLTDVRRSVPSCFCDQELLE